MKFSLRRAAQEDMPSIRALVHRVHLNRRDLDWRRFWVAVDRSDQIIGIGQIKPHPDGSFELATIGVQPEHQGAGIGQALIEKLLDGSPRPLYLMCRARMEPFYEKFGFREALPSEITPYFRFIWRLFSFLKGAFPARFQGRIMIKHT